MIGKKPSTMGIIGGLLIGLLLIWAGARAQENVGPAPVARDEAVVNKKLSLLCDMTRANQQVYEALLDYATCVLKPDWIKTEEDLLSLFPRKHALIHQLIRYCNQPGGIPGPERQIDPWLAYQKELETLGIQAAIGEGMITTLGDGPFLEDFLARVASEPCRLFLQMKDLRTRSFNHEYMYMYLEADVELIEVGEKFLRFFPDSRFINEVKAMLSEALIPMSDIHSLGPGYYIVGGISRHFYPGKTDIKFHQMFIANNPVSRFRDVVARILDNMSDISHDGPIYAVVTDACPSEEAARQLVSSYLLQGLDIPHVLEDSGISYVAYRFYTDKAKADQALESIRKFKPQALIRVF